VCGGMRRYAHDVDRATFGEGYMTTEDIEAVRNSADKRQVLEKELAALRKDHHELATEVIPSGDASWPMPVNLKRLIWNAQKTFTCGHPAEVTGLSPVEVAQVSRPERRAHGLLLVGWDGVCPSEPTRLTSEQPYHTRIREHDHSSTYKNMSRKTTPVVPPLASTVTALVRWAEPVGIEAGICTASAIKRDTDGEV
jgi:hypothetical protein